MRTSDSISEMNIRDGPRRLVSGGTGRPVSEWLPLVTLFPVDYCLLSVFV